MEIEPIRWSGETLMILDQTRLPLDQVCLLYTSDAADE